MKLLGIQGTGEDGMSLRFDCSYVHIEKNWKLTYPGWWLWFSTISCFYASNVPISYVSSVHHVIKSFAAYIANILWVYSYFLNQREPLAVIYLLLGGI
jgi:hypothetical protein